MICLLVPFYPLRRESLFWKPLPDRATGYYAGGMDTPNYNPTSLTIAVDWIHIREAERRGANGNRAVTPFSLALVEQSQFSSGRITDEAVIFIDYDGHQVSYPPCQPLQEYLAAWMYGESLQPARFALERGDSSKTP